MRISDWSSDVCSSDLPRPWDVRAQLERAYRALGIEFEYVDVDLQTAGSLLDSGRIDAFITYTNSQETTSPWIIETSLGTDWAGLNPSKDEIERKSGWEGKRVSGRVGFGGAGSKKMTKKTYIKQN